MACLSCVLVRRAAVETVSLLLHKQLQPRRKTLLASSEDSLDTEQEKANAKIQATKLHMSWAHRDFKHAFPSGLLHRHENRNWRDDGGCRRRLRTRRCVSQPFKETRRWPGGGESRVSAGTLQERAGLWPGCSPVKAILYARQVPQKGDSSKLLFSRQTVPGWHRKGRVEAHQRRPNGTGLRCSLEAGIGLVRSDRNNLIIYSTSESWL